MTAISPEAHDLLTVEDTAHQINFRHLVRQGYEWMEVTCAPYRAQEHGRSRIAMGLTITSSFGAFGFNYHSIALDAEASVEKVAMTFLSEIAKDELLGKLVEDKPEVFDLEATRRHMEKVCTEVLEQAGEYPDEHAALLEAQASLMELFDDLESDSYAPAVQAHLLYESPSFHLIAGDDSWEDLRFQTGDRRMREAEGLFDKLWIPYQVHLTQRLSDLR